MGPIEDAALCYIMLLQIEIFVVKILYYMLKGLSGYLSGSKLLFSYLNQINELLKNLWALVDWRYRECVWDLKTM